MAYNENGEYYFDPQNDLDDQELFNDEVKRQTARNAVQQQQKLASQHQETNNMWFETLKEEGLDAQTYEQLYAEDPEHAKRLMQTGMQHLAKGIKRGRDKKGRFTKSGGPVPVGQRSHVETGRMTEIRAKAEKGGVLTDADEADLIDNLFPEGL